MQYQYLITFSFVNGVLFSSGSLVPRSFVTRSFVLGSFCGQRLVIRMSHNHLVIGSFYGKIFSD
jgi:hypothetical protein